MGLAVGLCVGFIGPADCFGSELMRGIEQRDGQGEITSGDLSGITENMEEGNVNGDLGADWEEEFTDTDTRRGILAVRSEVFQGFGGQVRIVVKEMEGGRETAISLTGESDYMANRELRPGRYQVVSVEADSDGRKFDCHVEPGEMDVDTDGVTLCRVFVRPGSVYQVTYEAEEEIQARESGDEGMEQILETAEGETGENEKLELGVMERDSSLEGQGGVSAVLLIAALGIAISLYGAVWVIRRHGK